jgi:hypothetical protein
LRNIFEKEIEKEKEEIMIKENGRYFGAVQQNELPEKGSPDRRMGQGFVWLGSRLLL